ncbi:MAG: DoxX family protein [Lapillicoccus sp.]
MSTQFHRPDELETEAASDSPPTRAIELDPRVGDDTGSTARVGPVPTTTLGFANDDVVHHRRHIVDRFDNAAGLFLLRLTAAAVMGIHGLQKTQAQTATEQQLRSLRIPAPDTLALLFGPLEIAIAVALVLGVAVRAAGLGTAIIAISALVLVRWTAMDAIFVADRPGFVGETELLLAGIGLMLLGVGGGGWGLDHKVRNRRTA